MAKRAMPGTQIKRAAQITPAALNKQIYLNYVLVVLVEDVEVVDVVEVVEHPVGAQLVDVALVLWLLPLEAAIPTPIPMAPTATAPTTHNGNVPTSI